MIGCAIPFHCLQPKICWKYSMIASVILPRSLLRKSLSRIGTPDSLTPLWPTQSWIELSTTLIPFLCWEIPKENYEDSAPCRTLDVQYFQPAFSLSDCAACSGITVRHDRNPQSTWLSFFAGLLGDVWCDLIASRFGEANLTKPLSLIGNR
jgi:hypothetical protein